MDCKLGSTSRLFNSKLFQTSDYSNNGIRPSLSSTDIKRRSYSQIRSVLNEDLQDLLYVDDLSEEEVIVCLLRRYLSNKYFTYFGNVLFYVQPLDRDPLIDFSGFLYSEESRECHLFPFLREVLKRLLREQGKESSSVEDKFKEKDLVRQISEQFSSIDSTENTKNFNVFFYGDSNFGQLEVTQKSLVFLTQLVHSLGLEPTGKFNAKVLNAMKLMESLSDYNTNEKFCNNMMTYKLNFDESNHLVSVSLVPNYATDLSCCVVSNLFREFLSVNLKPSFADLNVRLPSFFYGLLNSLARARNMQWFSECKLTPECAEKILEYMPQHEVRDYTYHIGNFAKMMDLLLMVGFNVDELKLTVNIFLGVLLLDVYSLLKNTWVRTSSTSSYKNADSVQLSVRSGSGPQSTDRSSTSSATGTSLDEDGKLKIWLCGKDLFDEILDILQIDLLKKPNSELKYNDILFKFDVAAQARSPIYDELAAAVYLRLKHMIYARVNSYLAPQEGKKSTKTLSLHVNSGFNPYSQYIKFSDYHLAWYTSEEFFMNKVLNWALNGETGSVYSEFAKRNSEFVRSTTVRGGLLSNVIMETASHQNEAETQVLDGQVFHSWENMTYNMAKVVKIESTLYSLPPMIRTLLKYSKNDVLKAALFSNRSLHPMVGNCASALGYYFHLEESVKESDPSYLVVCSTPVKWAGTVSFDEMAEALMESFSKKLPLQEICNAQRSLDTVAVPLKEFAETYMPLVYMLTGQKYHGSLPLLKHDQVAELLFSVLSVSTGMYRTHRGVLTMQKCLYVRIVALMKDYMNNHVPSVKVIQRWWRDNKAPVLRRALVVLVTRVQARARMIYLRKLTALSKSGRVLALNFIGAVVTCFHLNTCLKVTTNKTLQLLHSMEKEFHEKEYEYLQHSAATYIQAIWRGSIERKKYSLVKQNRFEDFSLVLIQSCIRRVLACSEILNVRNTKTINAVMIQAYYRGYRARKKYQKLMELKLLLLPILKKGSKINSMGDQINFIKLYKDHDSVSLQMKRLISVQTNLPPGFVKVQNLVRMHFVRKQYLHLKDCLEKVHALAMTKVARLSYLEKVRAAVKIQRWWRCLPKDSFPAISTNPIYYINLKEQATMNLLANELRGLNVSIFHFSIHQDIRRIYPNTWAMMPLGFVKNIKLMQKSSADLNYTQTRKIDYVKFAVGSTHSLMLISTDNGSCVYSWGWNDKGQLGRRNLYPLMTTENDFMMMDPLEFEDDFKDKLYEGLSDKVNIVEIACGNDFSVALSSRGRVFTWGDNSFGQCGQGSRLVRVHDPKPLELNGVDSVCCASYHSVVSVCGEYFVFGNAFERTIFKPMNVKMFLPHLKNQTIRKVKCAGTTTLMYTQELDYVLNVFTHLHKFQKMYNLKGSIKSCCTNGRTICALVEISRGEYQNADTKIYVFGQVRCVISQEKNTRGNKSLFVGAFREKFENIGKKKGKQSALNVHSTHGNTCFLEQPTEVVFPKVPVEVHCDQQQLLFTTNTGVYGSKVFQILSENPNDFEILDNCTVDVKPGCNIKLEPSLYQFTNITRKRPTIYVSSNSLSHSIGYTF